MGDTLLILFKWVLILLSPLITAVLLVLLNSFGFFLFYRFIKKMPVPKRSQPLPKKQGVLYRLFWAFPRQLMIDFFERNPDEFREYGLHMIVGEQGSGKTTALVERLIWLQKEYPLAKVRTNMGYSEEMAPLEHWKDLVHNDNGIFGQIEVLDEIQTWFSSLQSKDFPPEMLTEISQQRKQRKMIFGTAQVFGRIAKPIREQTTFVYLPITFFGALTWVRVSKPRYYDEEKQRFKHYIRHYFFVHNKQIREAFDTYKKIEKYKSEGFKEENFRIVQN